METEERQTKPELLDLPGEEETPAEAAPEELDAEEPATPSGEDAPAEPAKESGVQKRIDELTAQRYEAERQRDRAWEILYEKEKQFQRQAPPELPKTEPPPTAPKPRYDDFENEADYYEAVAEWKADAIWQKREAERQQREQQSQQQAQVRERQQWVNKGKEKFSDFDLVVTKPDLTITQEMTAAILEEPLGHEVAYHLGRNPDEAQRISQMSPYSQAREIGRLAAKLEYQKPKPNTTTRAPSPTAPAGGRDTPTKKLESMEMEDYIRLMNEREFGVRK